VNADKIALTGDKWEAKTYYYYTGYPRGLRANTAKQLREAKPERILEMAIQGMLPKTKLGRQMIKKLKVYATEDHPHQAQQPQLLEV
jgi:large subunit ribosomal protein L13